MAKKNLYVPDHQESVWEEASSLAGLSLSALVDKLLTQYVESRSQPEGGRYSRIVVDVVDQDENVSTKAFKGRWLVRDHASDGAPASTRFSVAETEQRRIVLISGDRDENKHFEVYDFFDQLSADSTTPSDILSIVANELGESFVEELDI